MRKILLIFCALCMMLTSCNNKGLSSSNNDTNIYEASDNMQDKTTNEDSDYSSAVGGQLSTALDGIHHEMYYAIELDFVEHFIGEDEYFNNFVPKFNNTTDNTYRGLCEYYGISKDEYIEFWEAKKKTFNESHLSETFEFEDVFPIETEYDAWFADDYETNPVLFAEEYKLALESELVSTNIEKKDITASYQSQNRASGYTYRYYTIDGKLIDYVGIEKFDQYLLDTNNVNILAFIEYFSINKEDYLKIYDGYKLYPYNPDYLFSAENSESYFKQKSIVK